MTTVKRYVIYCNEEAYKDGGAKHLELLEKLTNVQVRAFRKAHKLISWLEKRETQNQRPCFLLSTWREARPCIQAFAKDPNLISMVKMIITCESAKQVHHVKRWVGLQPTQMPFAIDIAQEAEALKLIQEAVSMEYNYRHREITELPLSSLALKMLQMPEPAKIKSDNGRLVSTLPAFGVYSRAGFFSQMDIFDATSDVLLEKKIYEPASSHTSASTSDGNGATPYFCSSNSSWSNSSSLRWSCLWGEYFQRLQCAVRLFRSREDTTLLSSGSTWKKRPHGLFFIQEG